MHSVQLLNAPCPHACRPPGLTALTQPEAWQVAKLRSWSATSSAAAAARRLLALSPLLDPQWTNAHTQRRSEEDRQFVCQKRQSRALAHSFVRSLARSCRLRQLVSPSFLCSLAPLSVSPVDSVRRSLARSLRPTRSIARRGTLFARGTEGLREQVTSAITDLSMEPHRSTDYGVYVAMVSPPSMR